MPEIRVVLRGRERPRSRAFRSRSSVVGDIILELGINPQEVLVRLNGEFVPDIARARKGDMLELLEITSRG